jgi:ACT domain-containing protein
MSETFKQKVEEILIDGIKSNEPVQITLDRILAAYKAKVEGMPVSKDDVDMNSSYMQRINQYHEGKVDQLRACKSFLLEEGAELKKQLEG